MLLLDTHVRIWAIHDDPKLSRSHRRMLDAAMNDEVFISAISCWEVSKLVALNRVKLDRPIERWFNVALDESGIQIAPITPEIAIESNRLPGTFHRDPADSIIVATSRILSFTLLTVDRRILEYPHVKAA